MENFLVPILVFAYILLTACVLILASKHRINFYKILITCLIFTPLGGFLAIITTPRKATVTHYIVEQEASDQEGQDLFTPILKMIKRCRQ